MTATGDSEAGSEVGYQEAPSEGGTWLVWATSAGTAVFTVLTVTGIFVHGVRGFVAIVDFALFVVGIVGFIVAIGLSGARALQGVGVRASGLFLAGFAPRREQLVFRWCFGWTIALGLASALVVARSSDPGPFVLTIPAMAYGILVPIFPPALAGVHGARYCAWPTRG